MSKKMCWFCKYFLYENADYGYSEYTPGSDFDIICIKRHWDFSPSHTTQKEFGEMLLSAQTCKDYEFKEPL